MANKKLEYLELLAHLIHQQDRAGEVVPRWVFTDDDIKSHYLKKAEEMFNAWQAAEVKAHEMSEYWFPAEVKNGWIDVAVTIEDMKHSGWNKAGTVHTEGGPFPLLPKGFKGLSGKRSDFKMYYRKAGE